MNKTVRASIIFLCLGIFLLVIAYLLQLVQTNVFLSSAIFNAGFVLITVFLLNIVWALLGGEPVSNAIEQLTGSFRDVDTKLKQSFQDVDSRRDTLSRSLIQSCKNLSSY